MQQLKISIIINITYLLTPTLFFMPTRKNEPTKNTQPGLKKQKAVFEIEYEVIKDEDYYSCYIPKADIHFSVPIKSKSSVPVQERIKNKVIALTKTWMSLWNKKNKQMQKKSK